MQTGPFGAWIATVIQNLAMKNTTTGIQFQCTLQSTGFLRELY